MYNNNRIMSMSTPLNNLPLKTQHTNEDANDIQDPMVQDVLNEFQEELNSSKNIVQLQSQHAQMAQSQAQAQAQAQTQAQAHIQQMTQQISYQNAPKPYTQQQNYYPNSNKYTIEYNDNNKFPYNYIDIDLIKKIAIIVIVVMLVYCTDIFLSLYHKLPDNISDVVFRFDIYVRSVVLFLILYMLGFMGYI